MRIGGKESTQGNVMTVQMSGKKYLLCTIVACFLFSACGSDSENDVSPVDPDHGGGGGSEIIIQTCDAKDDTCLSKNEVLHCVNGARVREYCASGEYCFDGKCSAVSCEPNTIESCLENGQFHGCNAVGTGMGDFDCEYGKTCVDGACVPRLCEEGAGKCEDENTILLCNEAGTAYTVKKKCQDISPKTVCEDGACISICDKTTKEASYIGCEYWAADLDNAIDGGGTLDAAAQPFAVVLSNTHDTLTANIVVYTKESGKVVKVVEFEVKPHALEAIILPNQCYKRDTEGKLYSCDRAYSTNGTKILDTAFYIKSDLPITAAQFNPLENVDVFSNDASLLFPTTALGRRYMVMSRRQQYDSFYSFVTVIATEPGQTEVVFESTTNIQNGTDKKGKPIYGMKAGDKQTFYLEQYDILNLETVNIGDDPTGSLVTANKNVAVFAGNEATSIPETDPITCCADHIEHQQYPLSAWGRKYNAVKLKPRGKERDMWRILARTDGTIITTTPNVFKKETLTLNAGQWYDILTQESFTIESSSPVLVGQFMTGQNDPTDPETGLATTDWAGIGDPTYIIGVPIEQYRKDYRFLAPNKYAKDYITIVAPHKATVTLDDKTVDESKFFTFGTGEYKAAYILIEDGSHEITATEPIGLFSYGVDNYVSYGYPAGLDLKELFE